MYEENSVVVLAGLKKDVRRRLPLLQLTFVEDAVQVTPDKVREQHLSTSMVKWNHQC
jgi:hypothetical protein